MITEILAFPVGIMSSNIYLIKESSGKYAIIDAGARSAKLEEYLEKLGIKPSLLLLTHGHFDHIAYADEYRKKYGCKIMIHEKEKEFTTDASMNLSSLFGEKLPAFEADELINTDFIMLGETKIDVIATPGHTAGGCCYVDHNAKVIFTGDTMFSQSYGRTDFPTGSFSDMVKSLKLLGEFKGYTIYPGHGESAII
ncbi:MAG: MBL fold metallo-hydrolase [Clostridia bacterium]|nr:MBL fold metallo-hydrolase [Clostridia bacterium]